MYWRVASIWIPYSCPWQDLLSENGRFYLVALKQNNISGIQQRMLEEHGLESQVCGQYVLISGAETLLFQVVLQRQAGREHLFILRFTQRVP